MMAESPFNVSELEAGECCIELAKHGPGRIGKRPAETGRRGLAQIFSTPGLNCGPERWLKASAGPGWETDVRSAPRMPWETISVSGTCSVHDIGFLPSESGS
jgi:hypothetical protein